MAQTLVRFVIVIVIVAAATATTSGCGKSPESENSAGATDQGAFHFEETGASAGLTFQHRSGRPDRKPLMFDAIGSGVVVADFNGDEHLDAYFVNGGDRYSPAAPPPRNKMFFGDGRGSFGAGPAGDPAEDPGYGFGAVGADFDRDGDVDIYVCNAGPNVLLRNRGDGSFEDVTSMAGVGDPSWSAAAAFGDLDGDGLLDLYVANYYFDTGVDGPRPKDCTWAGVPVGCGPKGYAPSPDRVYRNRGDGTFEDVTERFGFATEPARFGLSVDVFDADLDGDRDVYVANDTHPNSFWENDGKGKFTEIALLNGTALSAEGVAQAGMCVVHEDLDADGRFDLVVTAFARDYNTVYRRRPEGTYDDVTSAVGAARPTWNRLAFGAVAEDFDLDGRMDLFFANGHVFPEIEGKNLDTTYRQSNQILRQTDGFKFVDVSDASGPAFALTALGRGAAAGDFDEDGRKDVVVNNLDGRPHLLMNRTPPRGRSIAVRLRAAPNVLDRNCVGAVVSVTAGGKMRIREVSSGGSYASSSLDDLFFGLGDAEVVDEISVRYADGVVERRANVPAEGRVVFLRSRP